MLQIAEFISPTPTPVWKLAQQCGVTLAVGGLPFDSLKPGEKLGDLAPLTRMKADYEAGGFKLEVIEARTDRGAAGVPKPELVDDAGAPWRSRMDGSQWQVNSGHEDYLALDDGRGRVRYLVSLLAKEIVQRTYSLPGQGEVLEHLVAVIAHAERNLRGAASD